MSVIATLSVPAEDFVMGAALSVNPGLDVRLERVVPFGGAFVPYLWVSNESVDEIESELGRVSDIESFEVVNEVDDEALVRIEWGESADGLFDVLVRTEASILEAVGGADTWRLQLRFDDHDDLTAFYRQCAERDIALDLESVHNPGMPRPFDAEDGLTDPQRETLRLALERGYFDVPRRINVVELAEELGISDSAVSQRLRRGTATVLETVLAESERSATDG